MTRTATAPTAKAAVVVGLLAQIPERKIARVLGITPEYVQAIRRESGLPKPPMPFAEQVRRNKIKLGAVYLSSVVTRLHDDVLDVLGATIPPGASLADHLVDLLTEAGRKMIGAKG